MKKKTFFVFQQPFLLNLIENQFFGNCGDRQVYLEHLPELTDEKSEAYKAGYKRISDITIERSKRVAGRIIE